MSEEHYWRGEDRSKGPRFQIRLPTVLVLMFTSGILMWANFRTYVATAYSQGGPEPTGTTTGQGWPFNFRPTVFGNSFVLNPNPVSVALNLFVAFVILIIVYKAAEWWIRRGRTRKDH